MQSTAERRVPRVPVQLTVEVRPEGFEEGFPAECVDVGYGGMAMRTSLVPEVGERLRCRFAPPRGGEPVEAECEVVWSQDRGPVSGRFGLRFLRLGVREAEVVRALVDGAQGLAPDTNRSPAPVRTELQVDGCPEPLSGVLAQQGRALRFEQPLPFFAEGRRARLRDGTPVRVAGLEVVPGDPPAIRVLLEPISGEHEMESSTAKAASDVSEMDRTWRDPSPFETMSEAASQPSGGGEDSWRSLVGAQLTSSPFDEEGSEAPPAAAPREEAGTFRVEEETDALLASVARPAWRERIPRFVETLREHTGVASGGLRRLWARRRAALRSLRPAGRRLAVLLAPLGMLLVALPRRLARTLRLLLRRPVPRTTTAPRRPVLATRRPPAARSAHLFPASGWLTPRTLGLGLGAVLVGVAITMALTPTQPETAEEDALPSSPAPSPPAQAVVRPKAAEAPSGPETTPPVSALAHASPSAPATEAPSTEEGERLPSPGEVVEGTRFGLAEVPGAEPYDIRLSLPAEKLRGVATEDGFLVVIPGVMALDRAGPLATRHPHVARAMVLNQSGRAELLVRFVPGKHPPYQVRIDGTRLQVRIGR